MLSDYYISDGTQITIDTDFLGEGGEGGVYRVVAPQRFTSSVAKVLLTHNRVIEKRYKVDYMIKNPPAQTQDQTGHSFLIWPEHLLFQNDIFVGFLMPRAEGVTLEELSSTELGYYPYPRHNDKLGQEWQRFDRAGNESLILRLKLCSNIAKAIYLLHSSGHYVIGDLKPQNIMVLPNGLVSILDLDSCQITDQGIVRFESKMNTPEFNPPEDPGNIKDVSWDLFIVGIIFYKLLSGVHPFFGTCKAPYEQCTLPELKIKAGLFPHGSKREFFEVIPEGHYIFNRFPEFMQKLFQDCFDAGITNPNLRPTVLDWINKLTSTPSIHYFKSDKEVVFDTQKFTLSWESENGRTAEIEGVATVNATGSLQLSAYGQSVFKLKVSNEFGNTVQDLSITRFPTPVIESLKVPTPTYESKLNLTPITIHSPKIDVSINFEQSKMSPYTNKITELLDAVSNVTPLYEPEVLKSSYVSKLFYELKVRIKSFKV